MKPYGINNKQSGNMKFACCDMVNGCSRLHNALKKTKQVWKKRARRNSKKQCQEVE